MISVNPASGASWLARGMSIVFVVMLIFSSLMAANSTQSKGETNSEQTSLLSPVRFTHSPGTLPAVSQGKLQSSPPEANYDEQLGMTLTQDFASLTYNVTAIKQADSSGYGPAYLLNGLSSAGYWYQVGIAYNWPETSGGYQAGFYFVYEVFDSNGHSVYPSSTSSGLLPFRVNTNDSVLLSLYLSGGNVYMYAKDWNTGAILSKSYGEYGSTYFVGTSFSPNNGNGYFSGLMTEWYHVDPYYGKEDQVIYTNNILPKTSAWMWIDEYNPSNSSWTGFSGSTKVQYASPKTIQSYSLEGATVTSNAYVFISGSITSVALTMSYSIHGGGFTYYAPALTYTSFGQRQIVNLSTSPTVYYLDSGTSWSVSTSLMGSTKTERWATDQVAESIATADTTTDIVYYNQYLVSFDYNVTYGGSQYSSPSVAIFQFGKNTSITVGQLYWVDAGSPYSYTNPLPGSTQLERWQTNTSLGQTSSPATVDPIYYHQFSLVAGYHVSNLGIPQIGPELSYQSFAASQNTSLGQTPMSYWADAGSNYNIPTIVFGSAGERWITNISITGKATGPAVQNPEYTHQYLITTNLNTKTAGMVGPSSEWANAGGTVIISASANPGWRFESWNGTGRGSYSGIGNTTTITVQGPIVERGIFYASLTIKAKGGGSVSYSFNSTSGSVSSEETVYVPVGTIITLNAIPTFLFYKIESWSGATNTSHTQTTLTLQTPSTVEAQFETNFIVIAGITGVLAVLVAVLMILAKVSWRIKKLA